MCREDYLGPVTRGVQGGGTQVVYREEVYSGGGTLPVHYPGYATTAPSPWLHAGQCTRNQAAAVTRAVTE